MANQQKNRSGNSRGPVDRYNYVDRDIYSKDARSSGSHKRRKKKKSGVKRFFIVLFTLVLVVGLGGLAFFFTMTGRLDRGGSAGTHSAVSYAQAVPSAAPAWDVIKDDKVTNILLLGTDKGDDGASSRSDSAMLVSIDNKSKELKLTSFLRDCYVDIPTVGKHKLNAAFAYGGPELTMQTLENNFRIDVDKYVSIDFENFALLIDKMGGIDIDMSQASADYENKIMGSSLKEGVNHLDGRLALYYTRMRYLDSDFGRTGRQRQMIEAIVDKFKSLNPVEMSKVLYDYLPLVETNLSDGDLIYLLSIAGPAMKYEQKTMHVPNLNTFTDKSVKGVGAVLDLDLPENCRLLREFIYGEDVPEN